MRDTQVCRNQDDRDARLLFEDGIIEEFNQLDDISPIYLYTIRNPRGATAKLLVSSDEDIPSILDSIQEPLCFIPEDSWRHSPWKSYASFGGPIIIPRPTHSFRKNIKKSFEYIRKSYSDSQSIPHVHSIVFLIQVDDMVSYLKIQYRFYAFASVASDECVSM